MEAQVVSSSGASAPQRVIAVLGMHRSGTSCLTGTLQEAGLSMGDIHTWNKHNEKGNRENQQFVDLHDKILEANGGAWDDPPEKVNWSEAHVAAAKTLLASHAQDASFGFKDPRALLVLDGWKAIFPALEFVGIYRHPNAVAKSLAKRSSKTREESLKLWYAYNRSLYREYKRKPFPILCFDDEESVLDLKIHRVADEMGFSHGENKEKFYTAELKHNDSSGDSPLPWRVKRLLRKLEKAGL